MQALLRAIERLSFAVENQKPAGGGTGANPDAIEQLADAVAGLVEQMREEQKTLRQWAQGQQTQQNEIQRLLIRATGNLSRSAARPRGEDERP
jgi:hypothetical protein